MPRKSTLPTGASISPDTAGGVRFYRARIGARLREGGALRKAFPTRAAAEAWIREQIKPAARIETSGLTAVQIEDARAAVQILDGKISLREVAGEWLARYQNSKVTVLKAIETLESEHEAAGVSLRHRQQTKAKLLRFFGPLTSKPIASITPADIEAGREAKDARGRAPSASQKLARLTHVGMLFNLSLKRAWVDRSPLLGVSRPRRRAQKVSILAPHQAAALLFHAMQVAPEAVVPLAIKLFGGLRNSELYALEWSSIRTGIRIHQSKTGKPRTVAISKNLAHWLNPEGKSGRVWNAKPKVKDRESVWLEMLARIEAAAGFKVPQNALRHSFGSYYRQLCQSDDKTAFQMGNSPGVVQRHYADAVSAEAAELYWDIAPFNCEARTEESIKVDVPDEEPDEPPPVD